MPPAAPVMRMCTSCNPKSSDMVNGLVDVDSRRRPALEKWKARVGQREGIGRGREGERKGERNNESDVVLKWVRVEKWRGAPWCLIGRLNCNVDLRKNQLCANQQNHMQIHMLYPSTSAEQCNLCLAK